MPRNHRIAKVVTLTCQSCLTPFDCLERKTKIRGVPRRFCGKRCYWDSKTIDYQRRFWLAVSKTPDCWLWIGTINEGGYGTLTGPFGNNGASKGMAAHRVSWVLHNGPIPNDMNVCHRCDVRNCVRPDHLFLGTDSDNMFDMVAKRRSMYGTRNVNAKVTDDIVREIRKRYKTRKRGDVKRMEQEYGIDRTAIHQIVRGATWKHVL